MKAKISLLLFACAIPIAIFILPSLGYKNAVYKLDTYSPFWIFSLQMGLGLLLFIKLSKNFCKWLKSLVPNPLSLAPILLVIAFALVTSIAFIEPRSRIQGDESQHHIIAQNLYYNQIGQSCYEGSFMRNALACVIGQSIKTRGLSYIYMFGMPFFGTHLYWVHTLHLFFLAFALLSFYLALLAWLKQHSLALLATALLASCPVLLFCFRSASVEPIYITLFCFSLLILKWAYDSNTTRHWLLLALLLAFFAQTRSETIFCLFAFIGVVLYRKKFSILNSQFSIFLATLSFFSLPVLCTLSLNRDSDLQGGSLGAHRHLLGNIASNFNVMALPHFSEDETLIYPFLPYFAWLAIFGLITLIIFTIKELRALNLFSIPASTKALPSLQVYLFSIKYSHIAAFLLLLSPQYIILFDGVSADLSMVVQWRFALVILPAMSFLGAFFLWKISTILHSQFSIPALTKKPKNDFSTKSAGILIPALTKKPKNNFSTKSAGILILNSKLISKITLYGATLIILTACFVQYRTFIKDIPNIGNYLTIEDYELHKWLKQEEPKRRLFFYWYPNLLLAHGHSAYSYITLLKLNAEDLNEILYDYNGEVYFVNTSTCDEIVGELKMQVPLTFRLCDRSIRYFNTQEVFSKKIIWQHRNNLSVHKILGFNEIDPLGLLRIINKVEPTDSTAQLYYFVPKELHNPWKLQRFVNDSLVYESEYKNGYHFDTYSLSLFNKDTNFWKLSIIDTITGEQVHSDFWELVRVKKE